MENAADALKLGFGVIVFVIALSILFQMSTLIKTVTDVLAVESDKTIYYEYYESDMESVNQDGNRIVTLEDMLPTIYRYFTESSAVTIIDQNGEIVTRFDRQTETLCSNWNDRNKTQKELILNEINYILAHCKGTKPLNNVDEMYSLFKRIYRQIPNPYHLKDFDCIWNGLESLTAQRIDSDLSRYYSIF